LETISTSFFGKRFAQSGRSIDSTWFLRDAGLSPPTFSPVITVVSKTTLPYSLSCSATESMVPDHSDLHRSQLYQDEALALAYSWCFFSRLTQSSSNDFTRTFSGMARYVIATYFCRAFAGEKIGDALSNDDVERWVAALLNVRITCGARFTNGAVAHALLQISERKDIDNEFRTWFFSWSRDGMLSTCVSGDTSKAVQASAIFLDRGLIPDHVDLRYMNTPGSQ
jgi:hypothetical protein